MSEVVLYVVQRVHPERYDEARTALEQMVRATHENDEGCKLYALHAVPGDPSLLVIIERWASQVALEAHAARPHVTAMAEFAAFDGPPEVLMLEPIPTGDPVKGIV